jgi:hypothetical protein
VAGREFILKCSKANHGVQSTPYVACGCVRAIGPTYTGGIIDGVVAKGKANCGVKQRLQNGLDAAGVVGYYAYH